MESETNSRANTPPLRKRSRKGNPLKLDTGLRAQEEAFDNMKGDTAPAHDLDGRESDSGSEPIDEAGIGAIDSAPMFSSRVDRRKLLERQDERVSPRSIKTEEGAQEGDERRAYSCQHCGISFDDCVMFTIHSGYHGFRDPFECNLCGEKTRDRLEFFLHLTRAAHH